jgi:hypothetical protein
MNFRINWEALGIAASVACAIHCALMPLIITSLPLIGAGFLKSLAFELALLLLAFAMGFYSLWHGYRRHHHRSVTLLLFSTGMLFFLLHQLVHISHSVLFFILPGIILILTAHYLNFRFCRIAKHCHSSDCNH